MPTSGKASAVCGFWWREQRFEALLPTMGCMTIHTASNILNADLHCHSVVSDGTLTPEALASRAKANGVELWALTDHDEIGGQHRAMAAAAAVGLPYLTGTEVSVTFAHVTVPVSYTHLDVYKRQAPGKACDKKFQAFLPLCA